MLVAALVAIAKKGWLGSVEMCIYVLGSSSLIEGNAAASRLGSGIGVVVAWCTCATRPGSILNKIACEAFSLEPIASTCHISMSIVLLKELCRYC